MLRYAPLPTGDLQLESLHIALLSYLFAKQQQLPFAIRIEDGDAARNIEGKDTEIMQILEKFALIHDSLHHQSERKHIYQTLAIKLLEEKKAYICTCVDAPNCLHACSSKERASYVSLKETKTPFVLRLHQPKGEIVYTDNLYGKICYSPEEIGEIVILKDKGEPSIIFASACSDMLLGVTHIIDQSSKILDDAKAIHIQNLLGYTQKSTYTHIPPLQSFQDELPTLTWLFAQGYIPDAIINYLLLLSNPKAPKKIFTLPEAIAWFKLENIPTEAALFKLSKLKEINRAHLQAMDDKLLSSLFGFADADVGKLTKLYLEYASTINELAQYIRPIFAPKNFEGAWSNDMRTLQQIIYNAPMIQNYTDFQAYLLEKSSIEPKHLQQALRLLLTGTTEGPDLALIYPYIKSYLLEVVS